LIVTLFFFFFVSGPRALPQMHRSLIDLLYNPSNVQVFPTFATSPHPRPCYPRDPWQQRTDLLRGRETWPTILPKCTSFTKHLGIFYMPLDMGPTALLPLRRKAHWGFFRPKKCDSFGRVWTRELGYQRPARYL
jgi:hypothetical protein